MKTQTKTEATSRPYIVTETYGTGHYIRGTVPVIRFGDCIDAVIVSLGAPKAECEAKAVRIVKAVNEYDALCAVAEAVKQVQDLTKKNYPHRSPEWVYDHSDAPIIYAMNNLLDSITKLEEERRGNEQ